MCFDDIVEGMYWRRLFDGYNTIDQMDVNDTMKSLSRMFNSVLYLNIWLK